MGRIRTVALIAAAFFGALLVMYRFDVGMAVAVFVIAVVFGLIAIVQTPDQSGWCLGEFFRPKPPNDSDG